MMLQTTAAEPKTDTRTRTGTIFRCLTRINLGHRICFRGNVEAHVRVGVWLSKVGGNGCVRDGGALVLIGSQNLRK